MSFLFGSSKQEQAPATVQTVSQTSEFPTEIKPFITDVLEKAQAQQEGREFEKFEGPRIAGFTPEQEAAFSGIGGIAQAGLGAYPDLASSAFYATQAQQAAEEGLQGFDIDQAQRLINPFQQAVTDIEKREAIRQFEGTTLPQIGAEAVGSGGFGGSRQAVLEAEAKRNLQQQLGDIQARGLRDSYQTAAQQFEAERARQQGAAGQFGQFAQAFPGQALKELGAVQAVGETKGARDQRALDIALSDFLTEQEFPTRQLQEYQTLIRGFPFQPNVFKEQVTSVPQPSLSQQLLGLAGTGIQAASLGNLFGAGGGRVGSLPVRMQSGGQIRGGLSSLERHQDISGRTLEHDPMAVQNMNMMKARLMNQGVPEEVADKKSRAAIMQGDPRLFGTGVAGDPRKIEQTALAEWHERNEREAERVRQSLDSSDLSKKERETYIDAIRRGIPSGRSFEKGQLQSTRQLELAQQERDRQRAKKAPLDVTKEVGADAYEVQVQADPKYIHGVPPGDPVTSPSVKDQPPTDTLDPRLITPSYVDIRGKMKDYEEGIIEYGNTQATLVEEMGDFEAKNATEKIQLLDKFNKEGIELIESERISFGDLLENRKDTMTDIYNKGLNRISKIEDESQKRIAQDETDNFWQFIGSVLTNQVNDPRGVAAGIADASSKIFPQHAKIKHSLSKESRDLATEIERQRGEAEAEYARQGLKTAELEHNESTRLNKEANAMERDYESGKFDARTAGDIAQMRSKIDATRIKADSLQALSSTILTSIELEKLRNKRLADLYDLQVEAGKISADQSKELAALRLKTSLTSTQLSEVDKLFSTTFGPENMMSDGTSGALIPIAKAGTKPDRVYKDLMQVLAQAQEAYVLASAEGKLPERAVLSITGDPIILKEGTRPNISDIYTQVLSVNDVVVE